MRSLEKVVSLVVITASHLMTNEVDMPHCAQVSLFILRWFIFFTVLLVSNAIFVLLFLAQIHKASPLLYLGSHLLKTEFLIYCIILGGYVYSAVLKKLAKKPVEASKVQLTDPHDVSLKAPPAPLES